MSENQNQTTSPEIPASLNESIQTSGDSGENSRFEKIVTAGERVFAKFGIKKPGRGRPRKDGQPKKSDIVEAMPGGSPGSGGSGVAAALAPVAPALDGLRVKIFVAGCVGILQGAVGYCKKWVRRNATAAKIDSNFTEKALSECSPTPEDFKQWGDALEVCANQYGWDFEHMPAVTLGVKTVGIFAPFASLAGEFKKEIARQRAKDEQAKAGGEK
jgi:hypothetical protein